VVVVCRLEAGHDRQVKAVQQIDEAIMLSLHVRHDEATSSDLARELVQYVVASLRNVDGHQNGIERRRLA
jgi:hypothetical protein